MQELLTDALAVHRLTRLVVSDAIFDGARFHVDESLRVAGWEKARDVLGCNWCSSVWVAFGVVAARRLCPRAWSPVARALAFSTVAGVIAERTN